MWAGGGGGCSLQLFNYFAPDPGPLLRRESKRWRAGSFLKYRPGSDESAVTPRLPFLLQLSRKTLQQLRPPFCMVSDDGGTLMSDEVPEGRAADKRFLQKRAQKVRSCVSA